MPRPEIKVVQFTLTNRCQCDCEHCADAPAPAVLSVYSHFMFNFPSETWDEFCQSVALARCFDDGVFIGYGANRRTRAADILPECNEAERRRKVDHLEGLVAAGQLRAFVVPSP